MRKKSVPEGITLKNEYLYRFHKTKYLNSTPSGFFNTFIDSEFSVKKDGRFCGSKVNPGFFFSLSEDTSVCEFLYYNTDYSLSNDLKEPVKHILAKELPESDDAYSFIVCEASVDNILDLCYLETIEMVMRDRFGPDIFERLRGHPHIADYLLAFADSPKYGDIFTDVIGEYAWQNGFNGIRFLSARAIDSIRPVSYTDSSIREALRNFWNGDDSGLFDELSDQMVPDLTNLVLFRGSYIVQNTEKFYVQNREKIGSWIHNDLWQKEIADIEQIMVEHGGLTSADMDYLCNMILRIDITGKTKYGSDSEDDI